MLCILADGKPHREEDLADALNMDLSNFSADVLSPLILNRFCCRDMPIKTGKRGRPLRHVIIQDGNLPIIAKTILYQITIHLGKARQAAEKLHNAKLDHSSPIADELLMKHQKHIEMAAEIMELIKIPTYKDEIARILQMEGFSSEHIIARFLQNVEIITDRNLIGQNTLRENSGEDFGKEIIAREKYYKNFDKKLSELDADTVACRHIKELWNDDGRKLSMIDFAKCIGYPFDIVDTKIKKMLRCNEIAFTSDQLNRVVWQTEIENE